MPRQQPQPDPAAPLRSYPSRFRGPVVLACRKCQRKLQGSDAHRHVARLKKSLKKLGKQTGAPSLHVIPAPCFKLCPKGAVTVCTQTDLRQAPPTLTLIRTYEDVLALHRQSTTAPLADPALAPPETLSEISAPLPA